MNPWWKGIFADVIKALILFAIYAFGRLLKRVWEKHRSTVTSHAGKIGLGVLKYSWLCIEIGAGFAIWWLTMRAAQELPKLRSLIFWMAAYAFIVVRVQTIIKNYRYLKDKERLLNGGLDKFGDQDPDCVIVVSDVRRRRLLFYTDVITLGFALWVALYQVIYQIIILSHKS